jgi:hypothetical protein
LQATGTTAAALAALECYAADPPETERRAASARATRFPSGPMQSCISPSSSRAPSAGSLGAYLDRDGSVLMLTRSWHVPDQVRAARARDSTLAALLQLPGARRVECTAVGRVKEGIEGVTADGVGVAVILTPGLELTPKGFERGSYDVEVLATRRRTFPCPGTPGAHDSLASIRGT